MGVGGFKLLGEIVAFMLLDRFVSLRIHMDGTLEHVLSLLLAESSRI